MKITLVALVAATACVVNARDARSHHGKSRKHSLVKTKSTPKSHHGKSRTQSNVSFLKEFQPKDFVIDLKAKAPTDSTGEGGRLSRMSGSTLPAVAGGGLAFTLIQLEPCGMNPPHTHPRASEAIYIIKGSDVQIGFIADNGGEVVVNEMDSGKATFVPQGAVHFETNLSCEPAELIASNNHDDPGTLSFPSSFFRFPDGVVRAAYGIDDPELVEHLRETNPTGLPPGLIECRERCGLYTNDDSEGEEY